MISLTFYSMMDYKDGLPETTVQAIEKSL